ncbi:uncharacterized protein LOC136096617 [Hydra vulgaris]|uniref:uncharacterized protein LOC124813851 n=1 Tax=Hydra vulgaris TaxID=6087 RepID=UPI001F5E5BA3|nr:uncharacterized protein LOC124813851 [Hydra vulgaris]
MSNNKRFNDLLDIFDKYSNLFELNANSNKLKRTIDGKPAMVFKDNQYENSRFFDALARILNVQGDCTSIFISNNCLNVSFNANANKTPKKLVKYFVKLIKLYKSNGVEKSPIFVLALHMSKLFNKTYKAFIEELKINNSSENPLLLFEKLNNFLQKLDSINDKQNFTNFLNQIQNYGNPYDMFCQIEDSSCSESLRIKYYSLINCWYRITQDVEKVLYVFKNDINKVKKIGQICENPKNYHAEIALVTQFICSKKRIKYVGVSKLCCNLCHTTLDLLEIKHLGTHNRLHAGRTWKLPIDILGENHLQTLIDVIKYFFKKNIEKEYPNILTVADDDDISYLDRLNKILKETKKEVSNDFTHNLQDPNISDDEELENEIKVLSIPEKSLSKLKKEIFEKTIVKNC